MLALALRPRDPRARRARARRAGRRAALRARRHRDRRPPRHDAARGAGDRGDGAELRPSRSSTSSPTGPPRRSRGCTAPGREERGGARSARRRCGWRSAIGVVLARARGRARRAGRARSWAARARSLDQAVLYLRIAALGAPFFMLAAAGQGFLRGIGDLRTPLVILVAAHSVNVVLELLFVYGFDWGLAGSAWGTVIAQVGMGAAFVWVQRARRAGSRRTSERIRSLMRDRRRDRGAHDGAARLLPRRLGGAGAGRRRRRWPRTRSRSSCSSSSRSCSTRSRSPGR